MDKNQKRIVSILKKYGAVSRKSSKSLTEMNIQNDGAVRELLKAGVLKGAGGNKYYLNVFQSNKRRKVFMMWAKYIAAVVMVVILIVLIML